MQIITKVGVIQYKVINSTDIPTITFFFFFTVSSTVLSVMSYTHHSPILTLNYKESQISQYEWTQISKVSMVPQRGGVVSKVKNNWGNHAYIWDPGDDIDKFCSCPWIRSIRLLLYRYPFLSSMLSPSSLHCLFLNIPSILLLHVSCFLEGSAFCFYSCSVPPSAHPCVTSNCL